MFRLSESAVAADSIQEGNYMLNSRNQTPRRHASNRHASPLVLFAVLTAVSFGVNAVTYAQSSLPLMTINQLQYKGAFRLPSGNFGTSSANYSFGTIGYNPDHKSLFVAGNETEGSIAEFAIPQIVNSTKLSDLKTAASPLQPFANVVNKASIDVRNGIKVSGIFYSGGKLMVNVYRFYDQSPFLTTPTLILSNANDIKGSSTRGYISTQGGSAAAGWISPIPSALQSMLGGPYMCGFSASTARALVYNTSEGPSAYSFDPVTAMANDASSIATNELMAFSPDDGMVTRDQLYNNDHTNKLWTFVSEASFGMVIPGTRTYMALGGSGGHESGVAYGDPPYGGYKAYYAIDPNDRYPYYWLFDVNDFDKVRKGQMKASAIKPYAFGIFNVPFGQIGGWTPIAGGSFDAATGTLYLSVYRADTQSGGNPPVIVAYQIGDPPISPNPPANVRAQ
jgi:hypothetical protein